MVGSWRKPLQTAGGGNKDQDSEDQGHPDPWEREEEEKGEDQKEHPQYEAEELFSVLLDLGRRGGRGLERESF